MSPEERERRSLNTGQEGLKSGNKSASKSTLDAAKRQWFKRREREGEADLRPDILNPEYMEELRQRQLETGSVSEAAIKKVHRKWMRKLRNGDYAGPELDSTRYLSLRDTVVQGNPRQTEEYRKMCRDAVGVGEVPDMKRYGHLSKHDLELLRWVVSRG